jgi:hypothetical protein
MNWNMSVKKYATQAQLFGFFRDELNGFSRLRGDDEFPLFLCFVCRMNDNKHCEGFVGWI